MKIKKIKPNIFLAEFETHLEMCLSFMRMQEFYESPYKNIRGKQVSLWTFIETYSKETGDFTYFSDWEGFNIPGYALDNFYNNYADLLTDKEKKLIHGIWDRISGNIKEYYVIGTYKSCTKKTTQHELSHAYYYLDDNYRKDMDYLIEKLTFRKELERHLLKEGYSKSVLNDEMQAYLATPEKQDYTKNILKKKWKIPKEFRKVFLKKYKST